MKSATTIQYNEFAMEITDATDLGTAMLIAESEDGQYEPVAVVASLPEARETPRERSCQLLAPSPLVGY